MNGREYSLFKRGDSYDILGRDAWLSLSANLTAGDLIIAPGDEENHTVIINRAN